MIVLLPIITFTMAYFIVDIPKPGDIRTNQVSTILASDGSEIAKIVPPEGNRVDVNISQVPVHVRQAVIAAEDRNFYSNPGFDFSGFARAVNNNLFGSGDLQGGSTITQQYVKNALVGSAQHGLSGLMRKAKELVIATKMSGEWSKDDVLQAYLNIIYFGRGAYGISAASKAYFNKPVEQLTVSEGALLAALIRRPSTLDPAVDPKGAEARWNWVLDGMVETKALSPSDRAAQVFPATVPPDQARAQNQTTGPNGLIERQVTRELMELFNIDEQTLNTQGLQVTTTIDPKAQQAAEKAVSKYLDGQDPDMRAAVVSIDPHNGAIRAYYGGPDANGFDFAQGGLQTGSSFKVFALVAALEQGIGLGYQVDSSPLTVDGIKITNVEGESCGTCNLAEALKMSLNTSYYRLMLKLKGGPQAVADAAHQAGIATSFPGVAHTLSEDGKGGPPNNGVVLGQYQTRVLDMASAYATLAASGIYHRPHFVQKVVNAEGQVLFDAGTSNNSGEQRIDKGVADNVTAAMQPIAGYSNGHNLAGGRPSAAKTGTAQLGDTDANKDAWMVGYTPSLSTAVWVGTVRGDKPLVTASGGEVYGSGLPSDIWKATMDGALKGTSNETFPKPTEIGGYAGVPRRRRRSRRRRRRPSSSPRSRSHRASPSRSARRRPSRSRRRRRRGSRPGRRRRSARRPTRRRRDRRSAERHYLAGAVGRRSAQRRQPRLPQPHRLFGRRAGRCRRRAGGSARADRAHPADDPGAGDVRDRAGVPGASAGRRRRRACRPPAPGRAISGSPTGTTNAPITSCATPTRCRSMARSC